MAIEMAYRKHFLVSFKTREKRDKTAFLPFQLSHAGTMTFWLWSIVFIRQCLYSHPDIYAVIFMWTGILKTLTAVQLLPNAHSYVLPHSHLALFFSLFFLSLFCLFLFCFCFSLLFLFLLCNMSHHICSVQLYMLLSSAMD